jgi:Protein of unknown function (DUF1588)/Protein of unknown function (DUF1585)/Protein of unknown function (DUF1592)
MKSFPKLKTCRDAVDKPAVRGATSLVRSAAITFCQIKTFGLACRLSAFPILFTTHIATDWEVRRTRKTSDTNALVRTAGLAVLAVAYMALARGGASVAVAAAPPEVGPWFAKYCGDCHAGGAMEGKVSLDGLKRFADVSPDTWGTIHEQLQLGLMPPAQSDQPPPAERSAMVGWIAESMRKAGHHVRDKLALPNYGNFTPHEPLFRGPAHPAPATLSRAWRVRPDVYENRVPGIQPFALLPGQQVSDFASLYEVDESAAEVVLSNAQALIESWTKGQFAPLLDPKIELTGGRLDDAVKQAYDKALGRVPTAAESRRIRELYDKVQAAHGRERAVRAALVYPFLRPEAYYRLEIGAGDPDQHGRRRLDKLAIVTAIQQTLFGDKRPPRLQAALVDAKATLDTRQEVATLVRELLEQDPPGSVNSRVLRFFDEYFDYHKATDVFKEPPVGVSHRADEFVRETSKLMTRIVADDRDVLRRLLTSREAFVMNRVEYRIHHTDFTTYNLPPDFKQDGLVTLDAATRCGILTQPSWLVAHSGNFDNDPVRRGKWILEHLLGGTVPDVPVTVCAVVPEDPKKTLRERFSMVRNDAYCWKCHKQMNQLGMPFEAYDHFGRYRFQELGEPVDSSGAVVDSGDPSLDGPVKDAVELIERLATSKRSEEVFVRYAFRFFLGRNESLRDATTLREAHGVYANSQGSMKALVVALLSSDSFLYRSGEP